jgi:lysozyme
MRGIDVSHHNGTIDWQRVKGNGYQFAIVKVTEGSANRDQQAARNIAEARKHNLIVGAYHFAHPERNDPRAEGAWFLKSLPGMTPQFFVLDLEVAGQTTARWAVDWLEYVERQTGSRPWLYTGLSFAQEKLSRENRLSRYPLWIAAYRGTPPPTPAPWKHWAIWQYTSSGKVAGVQGNCDVNVTNNDSVFDAYTGKDDEVNQQDKDEIVNRVTDNVLGALHGVLDTGDDEHGTKRPSIGTVVGQIDQRTGHMGVDTGWLKDGVEAIATKVEAPVRPRPDKS